MRIINKISFLSFLVLLFSCQEYESEVREFPRVKTHEVIEINSRCETARDVLVGLAVSYTLNNTDLFGFYLKHANDAGISDSKILHIIETSKFIYNKAKAHVDILKENEGILPQPIQEQGCSPGCGC